MPRCTVCKRWALRGNAACISTRVKFESTMIADARATALKQVPNGTVKSEELEREKGKLIYSYDISVAGKTGVDEVNVNAIDGSVVGKVTHESPKTEKKEAKQEAKEKKTTK